MNPTQLAARGAGQRARRRCHDGGRPPGHARRPHRGRPPRRSTFMTLCEAGDHIVSSPSLYGGTYNLLHYTLPKFGVEVTFVDDPHDLAQWEAAIRPNTKVFFGEVLPNPKNDVFDIEGVAGVAHANGIAARRRQHRPDAVPDPPARVGRRHRRAQPHEVHRRSRHVDRRGDHRRRHVRLRARPAASPTSPSPTRATTASPTGRRSATARSSSRPACRCCVTSARRSRRSTRSCSCRASRR